MLTALPVLHRPATTPRMPAPAEAALGHEPSGRAATPPDGKMRPPPAGRSAAAGPPAKPAGLRRSGPPAKKPSPTKRLVLLAVLIAAVGATGLGVLVFRSSASKPGPPTPPPALTQQN